MVRGSINIGLAMHIHDGLYVPVIRDADSLSVAEIAKAISELVRKMSIIQQRRRTWLRAPLPSRM